MGKCGLLGGSGSSCLEGAAALLEQTYLTWLRNVFYVFGSKWFYRQHCHILIVLYNRALAKMDLYPALSRGLTCPVLCWSPCHFCQIGGEALLGQQEGGLPEPLPGTGEDLEREGRRGRGLLERARLSGALQGKEGLGRLCPEKGKGLWRECGSPRGPGLGREVWPHLPFQEHGQKVWAQPMWVQLLCISSQSSGNRDSGLRRWPQDLHLKVRDR